MGRSKKEWMEQDAPSGFTCPVCTSDIPKDSVAEFHDSGACSYCTHIMTKDD